MRFSGLGPKLDVDVHTPNVARVYDYYLGGAHNFDADRDFANRIIEKFPEARTFALENRAFQRRAVRWVTGQGVTQFLDLGSGIPTVGPTHETARAVHPDARVVYVDIEPVAVAHSSLMLEGDDRAAIVQHDLRDVDGVLREAARTLDFDRPVAVMILAMLHFLSDEDDPAAIIGRYAAALAPGSYLIISHATVEGPVGDRVAEAAARYAETTLPGHMRDRTQVANLLAGLDLVDPDHGDGGPRIVWTPEWHPDSQVHAPEQSVAYAAVARKP
jgi:SAM-dependent methyltransferase